jgi:UDP-3-O-[3-hydroxymyristoyl] glucosamine N-acyltransferase
LERNNLIKNNKKLAPFVHRNAICESKNVGYGTKIWAFTHVLKNARIGNDCNICENVFIENLAVIGDRVTIKNGVQIGNNVEIGMGAVVINPLEDDVKVVGNPAKIIKK